MTLRNKITIIIISYNRHKYLKRTIDYYILNGFQVLVIDGSEKKLILEKKNKNLKYINLRKSYHDRFIYSAQLIKTKYSILVNDDEFFFPEFIDKSILFLDKNNSYVCVCGVVFTFKIKDKNLIFTEAYKYFSERVNKSNSVNERLKKSIIEPSVHGYNAVMKSDVFKGEAKLLKKIKHIKNIFFVELLLNLFIGAKGKSKYINHLAWLRSYENKWIQTKDWNRNTKFQNPALWINRQSKKKIKKYIKLFLKEINIYNHDKLSKILEKNLFCYSNKYNLKDRSNKYNSKYRKKSLFFLFLKKKIKRYPILEFLTKLVLSMIRVKEMQLKLNNLQIFLLRKKIRYKKNTLLKIVKIINNFHRTHN